MVGLALLLGAAFYLGRRYGRKRTSKIPQSLASSSEKHGTDGKSDMQYAKNSYMSDGTLDRSSLLTPPSSSFTQTSFGPLLPEAHTPHSPAFSFASALPANAISPGTPASSARYANSMVSYNNAALSANIRGSVASSDHEQRSAAMNSGDPSQTITPYVLPQQPYSASLQSGASSVTRDVKSWHPIDEEQLVPPPSLRDIDPLSPSSQAATVEPFVLGPVPSTARPGVQRVDSKDSKPPPYSSYLGVPDSRMNSIRSPASATLVEYTSTANASQSSRLLPQPPNHSES